MGAYLAACRLNPRLSEQPLETEADLTAALKLLTREAEGVVNRTASRIFLATAISQYGALDSLVVAALQARMVWQIAHVFQRRPSLKHLGYLYTNVFMTSLVASNLEKLNVAEYLRPIFAGMLGQGSVAVPGVAGLATRFSNAVFQGSVNAFLTLRLGIVAIAYSNATATARRGVIWRSAVVRAGSLLIKTVAVGTAELSKAFVIAAKDLVVNTAVDTGRKVAGGAVALGPGVANIGQAIGSASANAAAVAVAATVGAVLTAGAATAQAGGVVGKATAQAASVVGATTVDAASATGAAAAGAAAVVVATTKSAATAASKAGGKGVEAVAGAARSLKRRLRKRKWADEAGADKPAKRKWRVPRADKK